MTSPRDRTDTVFQVESWNEETVQELADGAKITRARVTQAYSGFVEGESTIEYVMYHRSDGSAVFSGIERVVGTVGGRAGSLILQHSGAYEDGSARSDWSIVAGSTTDDLRNLTGSGSYVAGHDMQGKVKLDVSFP